MATPSSQQDPNCTSHFRLSIRTSVMGIVLLSAVIIAAIAIALQYYFSRNMAIDNALTRYQAAAHYAREHMQMIEERATQAASILAAYPFLTESTANSFAVRDLFAEVMRNNNMLYSIYLGYPNGDFYELINLDNTDEIRASVNAVAQDRWVVNRVSMVNGNRVRQLDYYAADFTLRDSHYEASNYDSRKRHWFQNAQLTNVNVSAPYLFQYLQKPGKTYAIKLPSSEIVLGIDVALQSFSQYLLQEKLNDETEILFTKPREKLLRQILQPLMRR